MRLNAKNQFGGYAGLTTVRLLWVNGAIMESDIKNAVSICGTTGYVPFDEYNGMITGK
jgi:hypothetical protein